MGAHGDDFDRGRATSVRSRARVRGGRGRWRRGVGRAMSRRGGGRHKERAVMEHCRLIYSGMNIVKLNWISNRSAAGRS